MWVDEFMTTASRRCESSDTATREPIPATEPPAPAPVAILGIPFDVVSNEEAVARVQEMVASRQPHYAVTANVDFLVQALCDLELRRIFLEAHLVLCDGTPLVWASRLLGNPLPERVAGADLVPQLIRVAVEKNYRVFFLGGTPDVSAQAVARVQAQYPALNLGHYSPPFGPLLEMNHGEIVRRVRAARPDLLFVSFGCPKAEKWIAMHYRSLNVPVVMGVGATIDFLAGRVKRAPLWMQRMGAEWIFRLLQEPRRLFRRYASDLWHFGLAIVAQWWQTQSRPRRSEAVLRSQTIMVEPTWRRIQAPERLDADAVRRDALLWQKAAGDRRDCLLEMTGTKFIDSTGVGWLVRLQKSLQASGRDLVLLAPSSSVLQVLRLMLLQDFFMIAADAVAARELAEARKQERSAQVTNGAKRPLLWQGEITAANAEAVWQQTRAEINSMSSWRKRWDIDLSQVRFIDSSGLGVMIRAKNYAPRRGARICFWGASPAVRNVLRVSNLESLLLDEVA